jgi:thiosulfate/3-mercaptopyruvate sulfurtransferase
MEAICRILPTTLSENDGKKRTGEEEAFMMRWRSPAFLGGVLFLLILLLSTPLESKPLPIKNFDLPRLVETGEIGGLINHPLVRIVDLRTSLQDYLKAHIPNAVYLDAGVLQVPEMGIPAQVLDRICLERLFGDNLSLSNNMWTILYSEKSNPNATLMAWALHFLGHKKVGVVNGGWEKWASERLPTTQDYPALVPQKFFGKVLQETQAEKKWLRSRLSAKNVVIVDARPPRQYTGEEGEEIRRGHIPGARNIFWEATLEGEDVKVWRKKEDLEKLLSEFGVFKDKEVVVFGRTAMEASHLYFTLRFVLGFPNVRLYQGAWVEWSMDKTLPVKTGLEP